MFRSKVLDLFELELHVFLFELIESGCEPSSGIGYPLGPLEQALLGHAEEAGKDGLELLQFLFFSVGACVLDDCLLVGLVQGDSCK
jgi:hypothetical protein